MTGQGDWDAIQRMLGRAGAIWRAGRVASGLAVLLAATAGGLVALIALDALLPLGAVPRLALLAALGALSLVLLVSGVVLPLLRRPSRAALALAVEPLLAENDNRLINAVLLQQEAPRASSTGLAAGLAAEVVAQAAEVAGRLPLVRVFPGARVARRASLAVLAGAALASFALVLPDTFSRGLARLALAGAGDRQPGGPRLVFVVLPGDARLKEASDLAVRARAVGLLPEKLELALQNGEGKPATVLAMALDGREFARTVQRVESSFRYQVRCEKGVSRWYSVEVLSLPRVVQGQARVHPPAYTGLRPRSAEWSGAGTLAFLAGSRLELAARVSEDLAGARATLAGRPVVLVRDGARGFRLSVQPEAACPLALALAGRHGEALHRVELLPQADRAPEVKVTAPGKDLTVPPGSRIAVTFEARDDHGVRAARLVAARGGQAETVREWSFEPGRETVAQGLEWNLASLPAGSSVSWRIEVTDGYAGRWVSTRAYQVQVAAPDALARDRLELLASVLSLLQELVRLQEGAISRSRELLAAPRADLARGILAEQSSIRQKAGDLVGVLARGPEATRYLRRPLAELVAGEMGGAVAAAEAAVRSPRAEEGRALLALQQQVLAKLLALLALTQEQQRQKDARSGPEGAKADRDWEKKRWAAAALRRLQEFARYEEQAIAVTTDMAKRPVDDFTAEDKKKLAEIAKEQERWGKIFKDLKDDLSRVPEQDQSDATQAKELVEIASELEKAAKALEAKNAELAVPAEQSGLEKAKELTKNIERWLASKPDSTKWNMEDPGKQERAPLANLPEELEDIVGDLIDKEEGVDQAAQDASSKWLDSMDKGVGWDAADGPIANMSAKGITGNQMPNQNEVGGRSGEGRSGRSSGQFVEEKATGKGGKETPTRLTPDPFEKGRVQDSSKASPGGSTGGGKRSGEGDQGLRGPLPPQLAEVLKRLAGQQKEIKEQAERLSRALDRHKYPAGDLGRALVLMEKMERQLEQGKIGEFRAAKKEVVETLAGTRRLVGARLAVERERAAALPEALREEIRSAVREQFPKGYEEILSAYYKALARER